MSKILAQQLPHNNESYFWLAPKGLIIYNEQDTSVVIEMCISLVMTYDSLATHFLLR